MNAAKLLSERTVNEEPFHIIIFLPDPDLLPNYHFHALQPPDAPKLSHRYAWKGPSVDNAMLQDRQRNDCMLVDAWMESPASVLQLGAAKLAITADRGKRRCPESQQYHERCAYTGKHHDKTIRATEANRESLGAVGIFTAAITSTR